MTQPETSSAQAAQAGLVVALGYDIERAWNQFDVSSLRRSLPDFTAVIAAMVHRYGRASATLAARSYREQRAAAGITGPFTVRPADLPTVQQVGESVDWATQPLWSEEPDIHLAQTQVSGAVDTMVLDVGRQTIVENTLRDRKAKGWARIPEPNACYFCAMLATRGAVYRSERSAEFKTHDHCRCHVEPVFTAYEPSAQVREWQALYRDATRGVHGMKAAQQAWRKAFDNRQERTPTAPGGQP